MVKNEKIVKMNVREAARYIEETDASLNDFIKVNNGYSKEDAKELFTAANTLIESRLYLDEVRSKMKICVDTFRDGYIGKVVSTVTGSEFVQTKRGKPYGYLAAIQDGDKIYAGYTLVSDDEKFPHPVIGQAIAVRRAFENKDIGITFDDLIALGRNKKLPYLNGEGTSTVKHFYDRCKRYFFPDQFSYSRGKDPIVDPNFASIHYQQFAQEAINAKTEDELITALGKFVKLVKQTNPNVFAKETSEISIKI